MPVNSPRSTSDLLRAEQSPVPTARVERNDGGLRLALAGGGTGGHMVPGLNVLDQLRDEHGLAHVLWFKSGREVEGRVLAGLDERVKPAPVDTVSLPLERPGGGAPSRLRLAFSAPRATRLARAELRKHGSQVLLGLGGFASAPAVVAARSLGVPVALLEVNAVAGRATRTLAPLCSSILHSWPSSLPADPGAKHHVVGPPVSTPGTSTRPEAKTALGFDPTRPLLLVLGGSQGAACLNEFVSAFAAKWTADGVDVLHQVGPGRRREGLEGLAGYRCEEYVDDVPLALTAADAVLSRGGASTIAEIATARTPAWIVPFPHHADQHQERNARQLGAGVRIVPEGELRAEFARDLRDFLVTSEGVSARTRMSAALSRAIPRNGAEGVVRELVRTIHERSSP